MFVSVSSTSSSSSVLMLDEWGGCGFPPARPSWLTDLWMTLSPPLSLRSHTPQQCHICPAAQSATIWNGFVLRTPKWLQITLFEYLCHSGCCRWWLAWQMPCDWQDFVRCRSFQIVLKNFQMFLKELLFFLFLRRRGCLAARQSSQVWPWCRPAPWLLRPKRWWLHLAMHHHSGRDLTVVPRATWSSRLEWAVPPWLGPTWEIQCGNCAVTCYAFIIVEGVNQLALWNCNTHCGRIFPHNALFLIYSMLKQPPLLVLLWFKLIDWNMS